MPTDNEHGFNFASYPDEVKDALLVDDYIDASFTRQSIDDLRHEVEFFTKYYKDIIENFELLGGEVTYPIDEEGNRIPDEYWMILGQISVGTKYTRQPFFARPLLKDDPGDIEKITIEIHPRKPRASKANELLIIHQT